VANCRGKSHGARRRPPREVTAHKAPRFRRLIRRHKPSTLHESLALRFLWSKGFATLLLDLLTPYEERIDEFTRHHRFDIRLLADRVGVAIDWAIDEPAVRDLPFGLFGASTGAAAALVAAAARPNEIRAVVSRGGRPDLAGAALERVKAPTLLIVGGYDTQVIDLNRGAMTHLTCVKRLEIVPGATHLFEEPGTLDRVAALAGDWFAAKLG
jgi:pimeloyl-ACP methyl ester carboxylesterase